MGDVLDDVFGFDPPPEPPPPPPPPPMPEVADTTTDILSDDELEQTARERIRREAARRGRDSLINDPGTSAAGSSGVNIL